MWIPGACRTQLGVGFGLLVTLLLLLAQTQVGDARANGKNKGRIRGESRQVHIVYMGGNPDGHSPVELKQRHISTLASVRGVQAHQAAAMPPLYHSYNRALNGFSASLSSEEVDSMSKMPGVVSVFPSRIRTVSTTRSWQFMGLDASNNVNGLWGANYSGRNVIIGLIDTGIWPESRSFHEQSMPDVPGRWKGSCRAGDANFNASTCNKKVIGGAFYVNGFEAQIGPDIPAGFRSARDQSGHGTHTSSTAAGQLVRGANLFGLAEGDARGGAPLAHLAMYKVCWSSESSANEMVCTDADILAAFDDAIADGVDVISVSLNQLMPEGGAPEEYRRDSLALGSFHAAINGIFVCASAGNEGRPKSVTNVAPWMTTVAASTLDRRFPATLVLGNQASFQGSGINDRTLTRPWYPLVFGGDVSSWGGDNSYSTVCSDGTLDGSKVNGTIIYCKSGGPGYDSYTGPVQAGAVGMVWPDAQNTGLAEGFVYDIPTAKIHPSHESAILDYIRTTKSPIATIQQPTTVNDYEPAPMMASFSSQGPNMLQPEILKPDLTAPGVDILASWTPISPPTEERDGTDTRSEEFNIISGTSMSTPHVAGAAALIKSRHPTWSAAAIRSALMTTASVADKHKRPILEHTGRQPAGPFFYGSGHINPVAAADPGLVYDISPTGYALFLCAVYDQSTVRQMTGDRSFSCPSSPPSAHNLNYPSIALPTVGWNSTRTVLRTLTNVGPPSTYTVEVEQPENVRVTVTPHLLTFRRVGDRASFTAEVSPSPGAVAGRYVFGAVTWTDGSHRVRAPIAIRVHPK